MDSVRIWSKFRLDGRLFLKVPCSQLFEGQWFSSGSIFDKDVSAARVALPCHVGCVQADRSGADVTLRKVKDC